MPMSFSTSSFTSCSPFIRATGVASARLASSMAPLRRPEPLFQDLFGDGLVIELGTGLLEHTFNGIENLHFSELPAWSTRFSRLSKWFDSPKPAAHFKKKHSVSVGCAPVAAPLLGGKDLGPPATPPQWDSEGTWRPMFRQTASLAPQHFRKQATPDPKRLSQTPRDGGGLFQPLKPGKSQEEFS